MDLTTQQKKELAAAVERGAAFLDEDRSGWRVDLRHGIKVFLLMLIIIHIIEFSAFTIAVFTSLSTEHKNRLVKKIVWVEYPSGRSVGLIKVGKIRTLISGDYSNYNRKSANRERQSKPLKNKPSLLISLVLTLSGVITLGYGWWNIKFGPYQWTGLVLFLTGVALEGYGVFQILEYLKPY